MHPVKIDPEIMGGKPCFTGTRVPVKTLFDHLEAGDSLYDFLHGFPSVSRALATAVLQLGMAMVLSDAAVADATKPQVPAA